MDNKAPTVTRFEKVFADRDNRVVNVHTRQ